MNQTNSPPAHLTDVAPVRQYFWGSCLPTNAYNMNLKRTRYFFQRTERTIYDLQKEIHKIRKEHELSEQENQIQIYEMGNIIKEYEEYTDGARYASTCDAEYYLHKYLQKQKPIHVHKDPLPQKRKISETVEPETQEKRIQAGIVDLTAQTQNRNVPEHSHSVSLPRAKQKKIQKPVKIENTKMKSSADFSCTRIRRK